MEIIKGKIKKAKKVVIYGPEGIEIGRAHV